MTTARRYVNPWIVTTIIVIALGLIVIAVVLPPMRQASIIRQIEAGGGAVDFLVFGSAWKTHLIEKYELERWFGAPVDIEIGVGWTDTQLRQVTRLRGVVDLTIAGGTLTGCSPSLGHYAACLVFCCQKLSHWLQWWRQTRAAMRLALATRHRGLFLRRRVLRVLQKPSI